MTGRSSEAIRADLAAIASKAERVATRTQPNYSDLSEALDVCASMLALVADVESLLARAEHAEAKLTESMNRYCDEYSKHAITMTEVQRLRRRGMALDGIARDANRATINAMNGRDVARAELDRLRQAVETLHRSDGYNNPTCRGCNREWPCPTAEVVAAALDGAE